MKKLLMNLPILTAVVITFAFSTDVPFLGFLKTESTFGWWVVVLVPGAVLLTLAQVFLWVAYPSARPMRRRE